MWLAEAAWCEVETTTIRNCWKKAAILLLSSLPVLNPSIPVSSLLNVDNIHGLEDLVTIAEKVLLNLADESHVIDEATDKEICKAVLDA
jgi:hypothetical protein